MVVEYQPDKRSRYSCVNAEHYRNTGRAETSATELSELKGRIFHEHQCAADIAYRQVMACLYPLNAWRLPGKSGVTFKDTESNGIKIKLPCGQCIGCRLERSKEWAIRCMHENQTTEEDGYDSCFVTLTYDDENLPIDRGLRVWHFQNFMKRLRRKHPASRIRFFHAGEYGEQFKRPHYHALLFGYRPTDLELHDVQGDYPLYISQSLQKIWKKGFTTVGDITYETAAYTARYVLKKVTGEKAEHHYLSEVPGKVELVPIQPEYCTMSRRPGIGFDWFKRYGNTVFPHDEVILKGHPVKPPRYYFKQLPADSDKLLATKAKRRELARSLNRESTDLRLDAKEKVLKAKLKQFSRRLEESHR